MKPSMLSGFLAAIVAAPLCLAQNYDNPYRPYDRDDDTIILYKMEEGAGNQIQNHEAQSFVGLVTGGTWTDAGRFGKCLEFDGSGYIDSNRSSSFQSEDLTFEAWVFFTGFHPCGGQDPCQPTFLFDSSIEDESGSHGRSFGVTAMGRPFAAAFKTGSLPAAVRGPALPTHEWVHLAVAFDVSHSELRLAINGVEVDNDPMPTNFTGADWLRMGNQLVFTFRGLIGKIDEIRVSQSAREFTPFVAVKERSFGSFKAMMREP